MYAHSNESLSLLKDIMNVQEELEKFQADLPSKDQVRLSVRDAKVSSAIHRLRNPVPGRSSHQNNIYFRDSLQSKGGTHDLSWNEDVLTEKSNGRGNRDFFNFSEESTRRENLRGASKDLISKKPPVKPIYNRSSSNTPYDGLKEYNRDSKDPKERRPDPSNLSYKKKGQENYSHPKGMKELVSDFSPRVSPYNDCKTTKTHLMSKSPIFRTEDMRALHEKLVPQSVLGAGNDIRKNVKKAIPNSCDISRDYGHSDAQRIRSDKFENKDVYKRQNLNTSLEMEYNSTFAGKQFDLNGPVLTTQNNTPLVDPRQQFSFKESKQKAPRSQSANAWRDANIMDKKIKDLLNQKEKENQFLMQNPIRRIRPDTSPLRHVRDGDVDIAIREIGSTRESESIEATGTFGISYSNRPPFGPSHTETDKEKRIKTYPAMSLPFENNAQRFDQPRWTTVEGAETEEMEIPNGKSNKSKGTAEKVQLMKVVIELRNQLHEKDLEILDLRNKKVANEMENKELQIQVSDVTKVSKRNEDSIEKLQHQIECQEKEIEFLKKCKQRLEDNSRLNARAAAELKDTSGKIMKYELVIEEKNRENTEILEKIQRSEFETRMLKEENHKLNNENQKLKEDLIKTNNQLVALISEGEENKKKLLEYRLIEGKLVELEEMQNLLIRENETLKNQINDQQIKAKEIEIQNDKMNKEEVTQLSLVNRKLKEVDEYAKKLLIIVESTLKGEELPIELILKHNRGQENSHRYKKANENNSKEFTMRQLIQQNLSEVETLHHTYQECMDKLCESFVSKYGNDCNLQ